MSQQRPPVFLERQSYRRRRLMDAARLLPVFGAALFMVPLLWSKGDDGAPAVQTSTAMIYVFGVWAVLILCAAVFSKFARRWRNNDSPHGPSSLKASTMIPRTGSSHPRAHADDDVG